MRDVRDMGSQLAEAERFLVGLPPQIGLGHPLEQPPRRPHLVIVFRKKCVFERHQESIRRGIGDLGSGIRSSRCARSKAADRADYQFYLSTHSAYSAA